jgi:hypothetical protein
MTIILTHELNCMSLWDYKLTLHKHNNKITRLLGLEVCFGKLGFMNFTWDLMYNFFILLFDVLTFANNQYSLKV